MAEVHTQIKQAFEVVHDEIATELFSVDVDVEIVVDVDADVDLLRDCLLHCAQNAPNEPAETRAWEISVPLEDADTLIQQALRGLGE